MTVPNITPASGTTVVPAEENLVMQTLRETLGELPPGEPLPPEAEPAAPAASPAEGDPKPAEPAKEGEPVKDEKSKEEKPKEEKPKATEFTVFAKDGVTKVDAPEIMVEFKANGKIRREPLDRAIQFAQLGVYNHEREQSLVAREEATQQEVEEVYAELDQREAAIVRMLTDPAYLEAVQERYFRENTPEREASRAKAEAQQLREQMQSSAVEVQGQEFFEKVVYPGIEGIMREFPEIDDSEEVAARLALMLEPLRVNGRIPLSKHRQVQGLIASDLRDWARATNERRAAKHKSTVAQAQIHEQRAKNALGVVAAPTSINSAPPARVERKGPVTIDDVDQDIMQETIRAMRGG